MKVMAIEIKLSIKDYRDEIKPYLRDIINILKRSDTWKIQSIIVVNFIPSKDYNEERVSYINSSDWVKNKKRQLLFQ